MQLILFFTNPDSLSNLNIRLPQNIQQDIQPFEVLQNPDGPERAIWMVQDDLPFDILKAALGALPQLTEVYYVYHSLPLDEEFLIPMKAYLDERMIFSAGRKTRHIPNTASIYEELHHHARPFTAEDFQRIIERTQPGKAYINRLLTKLGDYSKAAEQTVTPIEYPAWVRTIYGAVMKPLNPENYEQKCLLLKQTLEAYCRNHV